MASWIKFCVLVRFLRSFKRRNPKFRKSRIPSGTPTPAPTAARWLEGFRGLDDSDVVMGDEDAGVMEEEDAGVKEEEDDANAADVEVKNVELGESALRLVDCAPVERTKVFTASVLTTS